MTTPLRLRLTVTATRVMEVDPCDYSDSGDTPELTQNIVAAEYLAISDDPVAFVENTSNQSPDDVKVSVEVIE